MIQYFSLPRISKSVAKGKRSFPVRGNINIIFRLSGTWPFRNYGTLLIVEGELLLFSCQFFSLFSFSTVFIWTAILLYRWYIQNICKIYSKYMIYVSRRFEGWKVLYSSFVLLYSKYPHSLFMERVIVI